MTEAWLPIPGYGGCYEVSNLGRVRSLPRVVQARGANRRDGQRSGGPRTYRGQLLRPGPKTSGHLTVALGKGNSQQVHRLVLLAFVGPCPEGQEVLHADHDPENNTLNNLSYGTRSENLRQDYARGLRRVRRKGDTA